MNLKLSNLKIIIGVSYVLIFVISSFFFFHYVDITDLSNYSFIRSNSAILIDYKENNFLFLSIVFFIFSMTWILLMGLGTPIALLSGFIFGKWWGTLIIIVANTIGASLLYFLAGLFFKEIIQEKLMSKFNKLKTKFNKNELFYFLCFRFIGGGGTPFPIQNILPVLFNMSLKNYFIATIIGITPTTFVTVAFGSGVGSVINQNEQLSFTKAISNPEIYLPIFAFFSILILSYCVKIFLFDKKR